MWVLAFLKKKNLSLSFWTHTQYCCWKRSNKTSQLNNNYISQNYLLKNLRNFLVNKILYCKCLLCSNLALFLLWIYWQFGEKDTLSFWAVSQYSWSSFFTEYVTAAILYKMSFGTLVQAEQCVSSISLQNTFAVDTDLSECSSFKARKLSLVPALLSFHI